MPKTILITGASSGLGEEMARQFAALGHDLALCARRTDRLDTLAAELTARHPGQRFRARALDVNDEAQVRTVFTGFAEDLGRLDRVIINAGLGKGAPLGTGRPDANRETAMTNFVGALTQAEAAMQVFRAQGAGHLVMISSMAPPTPRPRRASRIWPRACAPSCSGRRSGCR
jgi:NADP-dependent 3-hydroxy acid dehydrogenase YdfG